MSDVQRTYDSSPERTPLPEAMAALVRTEYGGPERIVLCEVATPVAGAGEVIVRVRAAALNPADLHLMRGKPYLMRPSVGLTRPRDHRFGSDFAGEVVALGDGVTDLAVGDLVVGSSRGACAGFVAAPVGSVARVPAGVDLADAAAVPIAGSTAYQALDLARLRAGQRVLVNGAAGGVGTFAVQRGVVLGLEVTAVCSTRNVDLVTGLGAAHVVDYTRTDWVSDAASYDAIVDTVGNHTPRACRRVLGDGGTYVMVGAPMPHPAIDPLPRLVGSKIAYLGGSRRFCWFVARTDAAHLAPVLDDVAAGRVRPVIGRRVGLADVPEAMRELATGHVRGKTVVLIDA